MQGNTGSAGTEAYHNVCVPTGSGSRFKFNGMEQDPEMYGEGNAYNFGARIFDPRLGKFLSIDPKFKSFPFYTPYIFSLDMPLVGPDKNGETCVPCAIIMLIIFASIPEVGHTPTGNIESDNIGFEKARKLKGQWILTGLTAGTLGTGGTILKEVGKQFILQVAIKSTVAAVKGEDKPFEEIVFEALSEVDIFDAYISSKGLNELTKIVATSLVDVTSNDVNIVGINKSFEDVGIDAIFNSFSSIADANLPKGKYEEIGKLIYQTVEDEIKKFYTENKDNPEIFTPKESSTNTSSNTSSNTSGTYTVTATDPNDCNCYDKK